MNFKKDILLIDMEATGLDPLHFEMIQLAAVLLDKKTLKEKQVFSSYIKPKKWKNRDKESMEVNKIAWEQLKDAPSLNTVIGDFNGLFDPKKMVIAYYGGPIDMDYMRKAYRESKIKWNFDYHYLNLWPIFYFYLAKKNQLKNIKKFTGFTLEDLIKKFRIKVEGTRHDALYDCRIEAEILRRILLS
jgi:DNA polymerase III alpha subunit (gram-positive type)